MANGDASPVVLFDEFSTDINSEPFGVQNNEIIILKAFGFTSEKFTITPGNPLDIARACLSMLVYKGEFPKSSGCGCDYSVIPASSSIIAEEVLGSCFNMSACNNLALFGIPGYYRLILNTPLALGTVRIYMWRRAANGLMMHKNLFFGE